MIQSVKIGKKQTNQGAMNFSNLLDAPAGKHGFIRAEKGHLYFEDGVRGKFICQRERVCQIMKRQKF